MTLNDLPADVFAAIGKIVSADSVEHALEIIVKYEEKVQAELTGVTNIKNALHEIVSFNEAPPAPAEPSTDAAPQDNPQPQG